MKVLGNILSSWSLKKSNLTILALRMAIIYALLMVCRIVFYAYNYSELGGALGRGEFWSLLEGALVFDTVSVLYAYGVFVILSLLPWRLRERRWYGKMLFCYFAVVTFLVVSINFSDVVYFKYTLKRFTAAEFYFLDNDNTGLLYLKFMIENWYLVLMALALYAGTLWLYLRTGRPKTNILKPWLFHVVNTVMLALAVALSIGGIRGGFDRTTRPITISNATLYTSSIVRSNLVLSNPFCLIRTIGEGRISFVRYFDPAKLDSIYTPCHYPGPEPKYNLGQRNIVILILESFSAEHSALLNPDLYPDGVGFTPFLDSLMRVGCCFPNAYANGRKSIEAMPSVLASIPSYKTPFVLMPQSMGEGEPLPRILSSLGYATAFFCGSPHGSMGFGAYANSAGVKELYSMDTYEAERGKGDFDGFWGIWDEPFLAYMSDRLTQTPEPFFASAFTLSSHHPFVVPDKYKDQLPDGITKIHKGVAYTDMALRKFFDRSSRQGWFRNTIFYITADHVSSEVFAPKTRTPLGNSHIINILYTPDGSVSGRWEHVTQQINIMPTLLGLIGYDKPYFAFGSDIFNETARMPIVVNYREQRFQAITDSLALYFDEHEITAAYRRSDELLEHNIASDPRYEGQIGEARRTLEAIIQQYYTHLDERSYMAPPLSVE
ncbi:sulfatase [Bacteroidia bacterium]|nr:sulfatase [Bacteroidia bacterium]